MSDSQANMELSSSSLKDIHIEAVSLDKCILKAENLERLNLKDCSLEVFELIGNGNLRVLKIDDVSVLHLNIGDHTGKLEVVDVRYFTVIWPKFYQMISKSSNLRKLRMWGVWFEDDADVINLLQTIAVCFPQLSHLSLNYELSDFIEGLQGSSLPLQNVAFLELGWTVFSGLFSEWAAGGLLERCPKLKKLVIYGIISEAKSEEECRLLPYFMTSIVRLMRRYTNVDIQFEYE